MQRIFSSEIISENIFTPYEQDLYGEQIIFRDSVSIADNFARGDKIVERGYC